MDHEQKIKFLREVHIGDYIAVQLKPASSRRRFLPFIEGNIVGLNYYNLYLSNKRPDKVVPEQERKINLKNILEYTIQ